MTFLAVAATASPLTPNQILWGAAIVAIVIVVEELLYYRADKQRPRVRVREPKPR